MKNVLISLAILFVSAAQLSALPIVEVAASAKGKTVALTFVKKNVTSNLNSESFKEEQKVVLKDKDGIILYRERVNVGVLSKKYYNLRELPSGAYVFEVHNNSKVILKPFRIENDEITFEQESEVFMPTVKVEDNVAGLNLLALSKSTHILIVDQTGNELYSEKFSDVQSISKRFDFNEIGTGIYTINTLTAGQNFTNTVEVK